MNRYEDTNNPKNPPQAVMKKSVRNAALLGLVGSLVVFFVLVGVAFVFWTVAHPRPAAREGLKNVVGASGYYSTEGGHDPAENVRPSTTQDELKYRGRLTPPSEVRSR
jgi:hypothetical protein